MTRQALVTAIVISLTLTACVVRRQIRSNALEFLYPDGGAASPPTDVELSIPVRVGVAFAPGATGFGTTFTEDRKQALLTRVAEAFKDQEEIASVDVIPSAYLSPKGGFPALDRLASAYGTDLVALISYDQFQFSDTGRSSWTYLTLVGAYLVKGEKNETRTIMNAAIYDISSRAFLFQASGESRITGKSTPIEVEKELRTRSDEGFDKATDDLIANLRVALEGFEEQIKTGTVRGPGTPAVTVQSARQGTGGAGAGSAGLAEAAGAAALLACALWVNRRGARRRARR